MADLTPTSTPTASAAAAAAALLKSLSDTVPNTLSSAWTWIAGAATGTGIVAVIARIIEKRSPSGDAILKDRGEIRRETAERIALLEKELIEANQRWIEEAAAHTATQLKLVEAQKATVVHDATATIIRRNVEHPNTALMQPPPISFSSNHNHTDDDASAFETDPDTDTLPPS